MKAILARLTLIAAFAVGAVGIGLFGHGTVEAQVTGACPAGSWMSVVGDNIVGTACTAVYGGVSGDGTITSAGVLTVTKTGGVALGVGATAPTTDGTGSTLVSTAGTVSATTGLTLTPLQLVNMKTAAGLQMTGSASGTNFGLTYTPATGNQLVGTATSSNSTSDVASYDLVLPPWYIAGSNITLTVSCYYTNSSSSATVHTMAAAAYLNAPVAGTQGSTLIATSAQTCPITTAAAQTFTITGTTLLPGSYLTLTFSAAVTNGGGASTEFLTAAAIN